jgi:hypothetical protein
VVEVVRVVARVLPGLVVDRHTAQPAQPYAWPCTGRRTPCGPSRTGAPTCAPSPSP